MRTLERITVTGYKSIRELRDFELGDLNVLIGANGAGKSNFLSVFNLLNRISEKRLQLFTSISGGADDLLHFGRKVTSEINVDLAFSEKFSSSKLIYGITLTSTERDSLVFTREEIREGKRQFLEDVFKVGSEEAPLINYHNISPDQPWERMSAALFSSRVYHFQDTTPEAKMMTNADIYDNYFLKQDAGNLASFLYLLKNHRQSFYDRILKTIQLAAPFIDDFVLQPMPENAQRIRLRWRHKNSEDDFDISQFSDGTLRFICLTTLLLSPTITGAIPPAFIIIDEPEIGLHPAAMGLLVEMLRSVATKSQVIISTQSVSMASQFFPEEVIVVDRVKDESVFKRLDSKALEYWLEDYSLGEIWEMNLVGGRPR